MGRLIPTWEAASDKVVCIVEGKEPVAAAALVPLITKAAAVAAITFVVNSLDIMGLLLGIG